MPSKSRFTLKWIIAQLGLRPAAIKIVNFFISGHYNLLPLEFTAFLYNNVLTHLPNHWLRVFYLKHVIKARVGKRCFVSMGCRFEGAISIGSHSVIGRSCVLNGDITIGNNVSITAETYIFTWTHDPKSETFAAFLKPVCIDDHAWIGARAIIFPGVHIAKGAILGAGSIATKSIPEWSIAVGSPARVIGTRPDCLDYTLHYSPHFQ